VQSHKYVISISSLNSPEVSQDLNNLISCKSNNTIMSKNTPYEFVSEFKGTAEKDNN